MWVPADERRVFCQCLSGQHPIGTSHAHAFAHFESIRFSTGDRIDMVNLQPTLREC